MKPEVRPWAEEGEMAVKVAVVSLRPIAAPRELAVLMRLLWEKAANESPSRTKVEISSAERGLRRSSLG